MRAAGRGPEGGRGGPGRLDDHPAAGPQPLHRQPAGDIERKIEEATLADEYEQKYSKEQILTKYLNTASYGTTDGRTAVGVQAAAETYFSKPVSSTSTCPRRR